MNDMSGSRRVMTNGQMSHRKTENTKKLLNKYIESVKSGDGNEQVQHQLSELQSLLHDIKIKEKKKMDAIEHQVALEQNEIDSLKMRLKTVTQTTEDPKTNEREKFKDKYIMFCISERKEMSKLLHNGEKICNILKECYCFCENIHQANRGQMVDEHLVTSKKSSKESEEISNLQKQFASETSQCMLQKLKSNNNNDPLRNLYDEVAREYDEKTTDRFFEKSLELCWTMVSQCHPMAFSFLDEHMKTDKSAFDPDHKNEKCSPPTERNNSVKAKSKNNKSIKLQEFKPKYPKLELKYPAVIQGTELIVHGLKQQKVFEETVKKYN